MGILNITPDSFSDGGLYVDPNDALRRVDKMVAEGASIIDVGPESTRPGSDPVPDAQQIDRLRPVIEGIRRTHPHIPVSIDTRSATVAAAAIELGADIINDVSALRDDRDMATVARDTNRLHRQKYGKGLADFVIPATAMQLFDKNIISQA